MPNFKAECAICLVRAGKREVGSEPEHVVRAYHANLLSQPKVLALQCQFDVMMGHVYGALLVAVLVVQ